jgi:hypothetical protein
MNDHASHPQTATMPVETHQESAHDAHRDHEGAGPSGHDGPVFRGS